MLLESLAQASFTMLRQVNRRHDVVAVKPPDILGLFAQNGLVVTSMGRPAAADPVLFACAAVAGVLAAELIPQGPPP